MNFLAIQKVDEGKFLTKYNLTYETNKGNYKVYEMVSRNKDMSSYLDVCAKKADAVVLIMHDETGEKILLNREYRMAVGQFVYNFPAGLIDEGEVFAESAKRELYEETGLELVSVQQTWPISYSAVGISNETSIVLVGTAKGEFLPSTSDEEEIEAKWYTKDEVKALLNENSFAARTQCYCIMWANS